MGTIIISTDMEGLRGVCRWSQVTRGTPDYAQGCEALRADLRVVLDILSTSGHDLAVVDGHDSGTNLVPADVAPASLASGTRMPWGMIEGVQGTDVVGLMLLGYHGCAGSPGAMAHTWDSVLSEVRLSDAVLSDTLVGEVGIAAFLATEACVPIIGVSGDNYACAEAMRFCGQDVPVAEVKHSLSHEAVQFHADALERLEDMARAALMRVREPVPAEAKPVMQGKIHVQFATLEGADRAALMPGSIRTTARELTFAGSMKNRLDALRTWAMLADHT